jgi:hypothetical protein
MSPKEKFKELIEEYTYPYVLKIIEHMTLYYKGIGQQQLRTFWLQVDDIAEEYKLNHK